MKRHERKELTAYLTKFKTQLEDIYAIHGNDFMVSYCKDIETLLTGIVVDTQYGDEVNHNDAMSPTTVEDILDDVKATLTERGVSYDHEQERSMRRIVDTFNTLHGTNLSESQGWNFMEVLKMVRFFTSNEPRVQSDCLLDNIAYTSLRAEGYYGK